MLKDGTLTLILVVGSLGDGVLMVSLYFAAIQACTFHQQSLPSIFVHF